MYLSVSNILTVLSLCSGIQGNTEGALTQRLLQSYVRSTRPVHNDTTPVKVMFGVTMQEILEVGPDYLSGVFWLNMEWTDHHLVWDNQVSDIESLRLSISDVWVPDIELYNLIEKEALLARETVVVSSSGSILWVPSYKIKASCKIDNTLFPFDKQVCSLKFGSWSYVSKKLDIEMKDDHMDLSSFSINPQWDLVGTPGVLNEVCYETYKSGWLDYDCYQDITFQIILNRRTIAYWRKVIIPSFVVTMIGILSLIIPPNSSTQRFIVIFLIFMLFCFTVPKQHPDNSLLSSILSWCYFCLIFLLIHSILITSLASPYCFKSNILRRFTSCCGNSETETYVATAKILDVTVLLVISMFLPAMFLWYLSIAPRLFVH